MKKFLWLIFFPGIVWAKQPRFTNPTTPDQTWQDFKDLQDDLDARVPLTGGTTGFVLTTQGNGKYPKFVIPNTNFVVPGKGAVIQTVSFTTVTSSATTSNTYVGTALTKSITITSPNCVTVFIAGPAQPGGTGNMRITLRRNGVNILATNGMVALNGSIEVLVSYPFQDCPATTGTVNYDVAIMSSNGVTSHTWGDTNITQSIVLQETQ